MIETIHVAMTNTPFYLSDNRSSFSRLDHLCGDQIYYTQISEHHIKKTIAFRFQK